MTDGSGVGVGHRSNAETHRVIGGRRWRVSDPGLDEPVRQPLVNELMDARRAVKSALGDERADALEAARARVHDAKVALGERGPKWWEPMSPADVDARVEAFVRAIGEHLGDMDATTARLHLRLD
ncbi:MAG: hypothetical protein ABJH68_15695 [Ilumatobacter sp.]|uniref:hypothetical protein n=1 Tax=Ilumatobacter sp. TaxID=1967498 RepID=UPI003296BDBD